MAGLIRRFFPGGNTSVGFYSYYDYIINKDANRIIILKGGPGTGKSSLMKKVAKELLEKGYDVEFHHCSSDSDSIDGLVVPQLNVAMVDGTAPHVIEPRFPGAVDEIINLGQYWNEENLVKNKASIIESIEKNGKFFKRAYYYFGAAKLIEEDTIWKHKEALNTKKINQYSMDIMNEIYPKTSSIERLGKERHLFGSAFTPKGYIDFTLEHINKDYKIYYLMGAVGTGKSSVLKNIYEKAIALGFDVEVMHTPLIPEKIMTVIIKPLKIVVSTSDLVKDCCDQIIDTNAFLNKKHLEGYTQDIEDNKKIFDDLIKIGMNNITRAKENHDKIEGYYISNMDFNPYNDIKDYIVNKMIKLGQ
ncbi:hypothetical protein EDC19_1672 [Natranaerovirga hydrolytica]|uniref:Nephrocystin 3-like N-terminal domain-containing protein n=1 Tax=Natranaerovirga hydrolytica TaxID=680378 RepID=A0A4R1MSC2_9FIRM|nr:ATP-binding protein [Natranaerovirga hydrolytica]TCK93479.1 hypothetical protein EDC19_1672 [Natranaerovirga hydrolytica]